MSKQPVSPQVITKLLSYDYKNAAEKIFFTVAGILIALWINHCDEDRKKQVVEIQTLKEIRTALNADLEEISTTVADVYPDIAAVKSVLNVLNTGNSPTDSLPYHLSRAFAYSFYLPNTAAFETLKSRGMETITNDTIRLAIAQLYSVTYTYQRHVDDRRNTFYTEFVAPYLFNHFNREAPGGPVNPRDWEQLRSDPLFRSAMALQRDNYMRVIQEYEHIRQEINMLGAAIDKELKRLE